MFQKGMEGEGGIHNWKKKFIDFIHDSEHVDVDHFEFEFE